MSCRSRIRSGMTDSASRNSNTMKKHWIPDQARNDKNSNKSILSSYATISFTVTTSICVENSPTPQLITKMRIFFNFRHFSSF